MGHRYIGGNEKIPKRPDQFVRFDMNSLFVVQITCNSKSLIDLDIIAVDILDF